MELKRLDGFVALMPFTQMGKLGWDGLGACLAQILGEKLAFAGITVLPYYALGNVTGIDHELLTDGQEQMLISEFLDDGHMFAGSYALDDKRFTLNIYAVLPTGISLLAKEEDTAENWLSPVQRQSHRIASAFASADAEIRHQTDGIISSRSLAAWQALSVARASWAAQDIEGVRGAVERAKVLDPDFFDPLTVLLQALYEGGDPSALRAARKSHLSKLASSASFKTLALLGEMAALARRNADQEGETDYLKTVQAVEAKVGAQEPARIYAARMAKLNQQYEQWLAQDKPGRKGGASPKLSAGQMASLYMAAQSWLHQAEQNLQVGYAATTRLYGGRAQSIFTLLKSSQRAAAKKLVSQAETASHPQTK